MQKIGTRRQNPTECKRPRMEMSRTNKERGGAAQTVIGFESPPELAGFNL